MADLPTYPLAQNLSLGAGVSSEPVINIAGGRYVLSASAAVVLQYLAADDSTWTDAVTLVANTPVTLTVGQWASLRIKNATGATMNAVNASISGTLSNG